MKTLTVPVSNKQDLAALAAGDMVYLSGTLYTARDAAHKRLCNPAECGRGPAHAPCGPGCLLRRPLPGAAGVPYRIRRAHHQQPDGCLRPPADNGGSAGDDRQGTPLRQAVMDTMRLHGAVYLAAIGGAGALMAHTVKEAECIAFPGIGRGGRLPAACGGYAAGGRHRSLWKQSV